MRCRWPMPGRPPTNTSLSTYPRYPSGQGTSSPSGSLPRHRGRSRKSGLVRSKSGRSGPGRDRDLAECPCSSSSGRPWKRHACSTAEPSWAGRVGGNAIPRRMDSATGAKRRATALVSVSRGPLGPIDPAWPSRRARMLLQPAPPPAPCPGLPVGAGTKPQSLIDNFKRTGRCVYETSLLAPLHHDPGSWLTLVLFFPSALLLFCSPLRARHGPMPSTASWRPVKPVTQDLLTEAPLVVVRINQKSIGRC